MTSSTRLRLAILALVLAVVFSPGWLPTTGRGVSEQPGSARSMLAPGAETGVTRATPTALRAYELQRSLDRRPFPALAVVALAACFGILALTVVTVAMTGRWARVRELRSTRGSRAPPRLSPA